MLWRNSLIMLDRETETWWSHITGRALKGPHQGTQLQVLDSVQTRWEDWYRAHPDTTLLKKSEEVRSSHYQKYFDNPDRMGLFRAQWLHEQMAGKTLVYGATLGPHAVAVTEEALAAGEPITVDLGGTSVVFNRAADGGVRAHIQSAAGSESKQESIPVTSVFWFAWSNFYPNTQVIDGGGG